MSFMFSRCKFLSGLPDISKWNVSNVKNIADMFSFCESLASIPDISKWDVSFSFAPNMFLHCTTLSFIPIEFQKKLYNVKNIISIFKECLNLSFIQKDLNTIFIRDPNINDHKI